jgi:hypothetical protein
LVGGSSSAHQINHWIQASLRFLFAWVCKEGTEIGGGGGVVNSKPFLWTLNHFCEQHKQKNSRKSTKKSNH